MTASEARALFAMRRRSARAAGIETDGMDDLLRQLDELSVDRVLIFSFSGREFVFSVFVDELNERIVGCIRISRREGMPPHSETWGWRNRSIVR
jgi:hypothetical protein